MQQAGRNSLSGKKKKIRNKSRDWFMDYYRTNAEYDKENRRRSETEGDDQERGPFGLNSFEMGCVVIIALAVIGFFVKIVILGHSFSDVGF